jgi:hypothetical protein
MTRVRISTTVDGERLERARLLLGVRDCDLFDAALEAVIREAIVARELDAIDRFPYATDPELSVPGAPPDVADKLSYDGEVPLHVRALAKKRRAQRTRAARR